MSARELTAPRRTRVLGWLRNRAMTSRVAEILAELEVNVPNLHAPVGLLSGGQRQAIAVARAVTFATRLVTTPNSHPARSGLNTSSSNVSSSASAW